MSLGARLQLIPQLLLQLEPVWNVVLRVPPLFLIDEILRTLSHTNPDSKFNNETRNSLFDGSESAQFHEIFLHLALKSVVVMFGFALSLLFFMLWTKHLICVYLNIMPLALVYLSHLCNLHAVETVITATEAIKAENNEWSILEDILSLRFAQVLHPCSPARAILPNLASQVFFNYLFRKANLGLRHTTLHHLSFASCLAPTVLMVLPLPASALRHSPVFSALLPLSLALFFISRNIVPGIHCLVEEYTYMRISLTNMSTLEVIISEWNRMNIPCVLRTFWLLRVAEQAGSLLVEHFGVQDDTMPLLMVAYQMSRRLLAQGCETMTAVLGMTSIVSYACHYLGCFFQWVLLIEGDEEKSIGTVSALLFVVLALQTGLTGLDPEKRLVRLFRNFCLIFTAILHFFHNIVNPLLISLSASHSSALHRHARALLACAFLVIFPTSLLVYLWSHQQVNHWLLAVSAFSMQVIVKVAVSLMIYSIFLVDAYRGTFWEKMDDYVYYARVFGHSLDFLFGIFLLFNGVCILIYEAGGAIRAIMMCIHAYVNLWCEARKGWRTFIKRRTAVNKINSLPDASAQQLSELDDVCSICYQEMRSAKKTFCSHFFHGVCLRKWLYVQDSCPLCYEILYKGVAADDYQN